MIIPRRTDPGSGPPLGIAVVGAGYWGPNLVRNLASSAAWDLRWVCDTDLARAAQVVGPYGGVSTTDRLDVVLDDPCVDAVAIATPAATHAPLALACIDAGRHVMVEKPLAASVADGRAMVAAARRAGVVLMCDHTYCYTPAVTHLRGLVADGALGDIRYVDSVRINLGLVQRDIDVLWDLAPHDLSILDFVLPPGEAPTSVSAFGADPVGAGHACVTHLTLRLGGGGLAHIHVNWLSPSKCRTTVIGGSERMAVWDDLHPTQRLSIYDRGIDVQLPDSRGDGPVEGPAEGRADDARHQALVAYRRGDMVAPALPETEALGGVVAELAAAIREGRPPVTDGSSGVRVLEVLEAASRSLRADGVPVALGRTTVSSAA